MATTATATATTVRLPADLHQRLIQYCDATGAVRNRVMALALREYLGDDYAPALPVERAFAEPDAMGEQQ